MSPLLVLNERQSYIRLLVGCQRRCVLPSNVCVLVGQRTIGALPRMESILPGLPVHIAMIRGRLVTYSQKVCVLFNGCVGGNCCERQQREDM